MTKNDYIIRFSKKGGASFYSHLDTARLFDRVIRRAGFEPAMSLGFHPHPEIRFARALAVGTESEDEAVAITLTGNPSISEVSQKLDANMPSGFSVKEVVAVLGKAKPVPAEALYEVSLNGRLPGIPRDFLKREAVKKTKKGETKIRLDKFLKSIELRDDNPLTLTMRIAFAEGMTIKPELVVHSLADAEDSPLLIETILCKELLLI